VKVNTADFPMVDEAGAQLPLGGGGVPPGGGGLPVGGGGGVEPHEDCWSQFVATHPFLPW